MELTSEQIAALGLVADTTRANELAAQYGLDGCGGTVLEDDHRDAPALADAHAFEAIGPTVVQIALDAGHEPLFVLVANDDVFLPHIERVRAACPDLPIYLVEREQMSELIGLSRLRGFVGVLRRKPLPAPHDLLAGARHVLVIDGSPSTSTAGNLVRSAAALWVDAVLFSKSCPDPYESKVVRGSTGNMFRMPFGMADAQGDDLDRMLRDEGFATLRLANPYSAGACFEELEPSGADRVALVVDCATLDGPAPGGGAGGEDLGMMACNAAAVAMWIMAKRSKLPNRQAGQAS